MSPAWARFQIVETWGFPWEVPPQRVGLPGHSSLRSAGPQFGWKVQVPYPWVLLAPFLNPAGPRAGHGPHRAGHPRGSGGGHSEFS